MELKQLMKSNEANVFEVFERYYEAQTKDVDVVTEMYNATICGN